MQNSPNADNQPEQAMPQSQIPPARDPAYNPGAQPLTQNPSYGQTNQTVPPGHGVADMPTIGQGQQYAQEPGQAIPMGPAQGQMAGQPGQMAGQPAQPMGQTASGQHVVGDEKHAHQHPAVTHSHDHYHVSHHHRHRGGPDAFEHHAHYHNHEHNHPPLIHAHQGRETEDERREHGATAHTHDHADPTGQNLMS